MDKITSHLSRNWGVYLALVVYFVSLYRAYKYAHDKDLENGGYDE